MEMSFLLDALEQFGLMESPRSPIVQARRVSTLGGKLAVLGLTTAVSQRIICHAQLQRQRQQPFSVVQQSGRMDGVDPQMALGQSSSAYAKARTCRSVNSIAKMTSNAKVSLTVFGVISIA
jgi:hypothetical protein